MWIDLWAVDASVGEALLRRGDEWLLLSLDAEWQTVPLRGPADAFRWTVSSFAVPVGRRYEDLDQAVADVREASLAALDPLLALIPGTPELLPQDALYQPPVTDERRQARAKFLGRAIRGRGAPAEELLIEVVGVESGRLERCFERWGYSPTDVRDLVALSFDRLFAESTGWKNEADLETQLFTVARDLHQNALQGRKLVAHPIRPGDRQLEQLVGRRIVGLSQDVVEALAIWTNSELSYWEIQVILQFSTRELERRLQRAARAIGLAAELLRVRLFAPACRRAAESVLAGREYL